MEFRIFDLGLTDFKKAWQFQKEIFQAVKNNCFGSGLIFCRHYPVITLGRLGKRDNIRAPLQELKDKGIDIYEIERGGDITYHGPGQLVTYPVFNLNYLKKDIHLFLRQMENLVIDLLQDFGIKGLRHTGLTGVWIGEGRHMQKIASIGIAVKNWITFHGMSINIKKADLDNFRFIRPCGMDIEMTSLETVLGRDIDFDAVKESLSGKFRSAFSNEAQTYGAKHS